MQNAITSKYKKTDKHTATNINKGIKHARGANINRTEINGTGNSFITLKEHIENFLNPPITRLQNFVKNEISRINKHMLQMLKNTSDPKAEKLMKSFKIYLKKKIQKLLINIT